MYLKHPGSIQHAGKQRPGEGMENNYLDDPKRDYS